MKTFERFRSEVQWDDKWKEMSIGTFPLLVWCAVNREKITYQELNRYLLKEGYSEVDYIGAAKRYMGHPAGLVGEYMLDQNLPIINSLLVRSDNGIPGSGVEHFIAQHLNRNELKQYNLSTASKKKELLEDWVWSKIYSYDWDQVIEANKLDLSRIKRSDFSLAKVKEKKNKSLRSDFDKARKTLGGRSFEGESDEHKKLKDLVLANIHKIPPLAKMGFVKKDGEKEYKLPSQDCIDLLFQNNRGTIGVEVKSILSDDADLYRGIYQCIKYKYLIQAELLEDGRSPYAECILITQRELPPKWKELAARFSIKTFILKG